MYTNFSLVLFNPQLINGREKKRRRDSIYIKRNCVIAKIVWDNISAEQKFKNKMEKKYLEISRNSSLMYDIE